MPIKDKRLYPDNWDTISRFIRQYRAQNKCEKCGAPNHQIVGRWPGKPQWETVDKHQILVGDKHLTQENYLRKMNDIIPVVKIVLTVAHLDQNPANNSFFNLAALCQRCHLNHDRLHNIQRRRKNRRPNQLELF